MRTRFNNLSLFVSLFLFFSVDVFSSVILFSAKNKGAGLNWRIVNDTVMGGRSSSKWKFTSKKNAQFEGYLSLENNGGFASVRAEVNGLNFKNTNGISLRVKGDGRKYQFRIQSNNPRARRANYTCEFQTKKNIVQNFYLPYEEFYPTWRGRKLNDMPKLKEVDIYGVGFFLGDKVQGDFRLEVFEIIASKEKILPKNSSSSVLDLSE
ncbi:MAG: CIA30 family protein [Verrucomicrobiales bacterium]|nr:CIA30 family protein [Verrucomicrobiales bacterium]